MKITVAVPTDLIPAAAMVRVLLGKTKDGMAAYAKAPTLELDGVTYAVIAGEWEDFQILAVQNPAIMAAGLAEYRQNFADMTDTEWADAVALAGQAQAAFVIWTPDMENTEDEPVPAPTASETTITAIGGLERSEAITAMGL